MESKGLTLAALLAAAAVVGAVGIAAAQPAAPDFTVFTDGYEVLGDLAGLGSPEGGWYEVEAWLRDGWGRDLAGDAVRVAGAERFDLAFTTGGLAPRWPIAIQPGSEVHVVARTAAAEAWNATLPVPGPGAYPVASADRVRGWAPRGAVVTVTALDTLGRFAMRTVTAADVWWEADFSGDVSIGPGSRGFAALREADATFQAAWAVHAIEARVGDASIDVVATPGKVLFASVARPGDDGLEHALDGDVRGAFQDTTSLWLHTDAGEAAAVRSGDRLHAAAALFDPTMSEPLIPVPDVCDGDTRCFEAELQVPVVEAAVNVAADTVEGKAPPGMRLDVEVRAVRREIAADASGRFVAAFAPDVDLERSSVARIAFPGVPGIEMAVRAVGIQVDSLDGIVELAGQAGADAAIALHGEDDALLGEADGLVGPDGTARLAVLHADGDVVALPAAGRLSARVGRWRADVSVAPLTARLAAHPNRLEGTTVPGADLRIALDGAFVRTPVRADGAGAWSLDLPSGAPPAPGTEVRVVADAADGYHAEIAFPAFRVAAQAGGGRVIVQGHPGLVADVAVARAGVPAGTGGCTVQRDACEATVRDAAGAASPSRPATRCAWRPRGACRPRSASCRS